MTTDRTRINPEVETRLVPHIVFDTYVRRRLVVHLKAYAESNRTSDGRINFSLWRRSINDWLSTKNLKIIGTNQKFPDEVHENFFKQLLPTGNLSDIHELNTYSKNTLLLHVLVYFLVDTEYLEFKISDLYSNDHEFRAALHYLDHFTDGVIDQKRDFSGLYDVSTNTVTWHYYDVGRYRRPDMTVVMSDTWSRHTGAKVKTPTLENHRIVGKIAIHPTTDPLIFRATFFGDFLGEPASPYTGYIIQTAYEVRAEMVDRVGRILSLSLNFFEGENNRRVFEGLFINCGIGGKITLHYIENINVFSSGNGEEK